MAHSLKLQTGSETALDISTGDYYVVSYTPNPTGKDSLVLSVSGSTYADFIGNIQAITRKFTEAQNRRRTGAGSRVYVLWSPDGDANTYRSELYSDNELNPPGILSIPEMFMRNVSWDQRHIKITVTLQRRPYWEDNSESELSLANHLGSGTGGQTIYNPTDSTPFVNGGTNISFSSSNNRITSGTSRFSSLSAGDVFTVYGSTSNDGTYTVSAVTSTTIDVNESLTTESSGDTIYMYDVVNWVDIDGDDIDGDLPARFRMEYTDVSGTDDPYAIHYSCTVNNPTKLALVIEGESSTVGTPTSGSTNSSGYYVTLTNGTDTETTAASFKLDSGRLANMNNGYFKLLSKLRDGGTNLTNLYIRPAFSETTFGSLWSPNQTFLGSMGGGVFFDWGTLRFPPWNIENPSPHTIYLLLKYQKTGGFTATHDYVILFPAENYRYIDFGYGSGSGYTLVDDGIYEQSYQKDTSDNDIGARFSTGGYPELIPGRDHRFFFAVNSDGAGYPQPDTTGTVRIYYRARRSVV